MSVEVVEEGDTRTWHTGGAVVDTLLSTGEALARGDWAEGGLLTLCGATEVAGVLSDPVGTLVGAGIGFLLERIEPLHRFLDHLAGNPDAVLAQAATWDAVARGLAATAAGYEGEVTTVTADWEGAAAAAYTTYGLGRSLAVDACAVAATGVAASVQLASSLVAGVRQVVRETIADIVAWLVPMAPVLISGVGTGPTLAALGMRVRSAAQRIGELAQRLVASVQGLGDRLQEVGARLDEVAAAVTDGGRALRVVVAPGNRVETVVAGGVRHAAGYDDAPHGVGVPA
ncbi:uncharacterized protein YukE [Nocardioides zeae]|uniref:Uncharacterized protein YukE n=2 Tax=Nocardioides zeae TaxID=1457234 RepID=A0AAJ1X289_9ACTN|nr:hypothetical protein [Nocardioides zeae]MDQ1105019.1 uncharacterized protein YukE [Nocardioides zeae]MDR6175267.1 uncharacterized protein YukE [Nocardioides zeae]MDR6211241.1 uncharacterized protein YukE [Nocardioides zeae]